MGIALIFIGLFLCFTLAFNGSVGTTFVNYAFFISAVLMIIAGSLRLALTNSFISRVVCSAALICYSPMIWQRFKFNTDWVGLYFDIAFVLFMLIFICLKPKNKKPAIEKDE